MKKNQIILHPDKHYFEFEGKIFRQKHIKYKKIDGVAHQDKVIFEEVNLKEEQKKIDFIKNKLKKQVLPERIIEEVLKSTQTTELNRLYKLLKDKKVKVKRQDGCLGIKIDGGKRKSAYVELYC